MQKSLKKISAAVLCGVILFSAAACMSDIVNDNAVTTAIDSTASTDAETENYQELTLLERLQLDYNSIPDDLPQEDYEGITFTIMPKALDTSIILHEDSAEVVNSALYKKTINIEERFNIVLQTLTYDYGGYSKYVSDTNKIIMSDDSTVDILENWSTTLSLWAVRGYFVDMSEIDTIDFSKPWFVQDATDKISYKHHIYGSVGFASNRMTESLGCTFFNKDIAEDYGINDLYQVVRDGGWTFEYVKSIIKGMYSDLNGNSAVDFDADQFGYDIPIAQFSYTNMPTMGVYMIGKDSDDVPYLLPSSNIEYVEKVMTELKEFAHGTTDVAYSDWSNWIFQKNQCFMESQTLNFAPGYRSVDFNIGILPNYKYDESQENYGSAFIPDPFSIPVSCSDTERAGVIYSALAAGGYKNVTTAYFEIAVKTKSTTDEDSAEMLDLIASNITSDGIVMFGTDLVYNLLDFCNTSKGFASFWASREINQSNKLQQFCEKFDAMIVN